jgi:hypothetical protein
MFQFRISSEIMNQFPTFGRNLCTEISSMQGLYHHMATQHRNTGTNIHALSGIRIHDSSIQAANFHALGRAVTLISRNNIR